MRLFAVLAMVVLSGCLQPQTIESARLDEPGPIVAMPYCLDAMQRGSGAGWQRLVSLSCEAAGESDLAEVRVPGTRPLADRLVSIRDEFVGKGWTTDEWVYEGWPKSPGTEFVPPLDEDDIDGLRTPVLRLRLEEGKPRVAFVTNIEAREDSPRDEARPDRPNPSTDLSSSGAAYLLAAMEALVPGAGGPSVDVYFFTGELGYRNWSGLGIVPMFREKDVDWLQYDAVIGVQNVGTCDPVRPELAPPFEHNREYREGQERLLGLVRPVLDRHGIPVGEHLFPGASNGFGDFEFHRQPAEYLPRVSSVDGLLLSNGWWGSERFTFAGTHQDTLENICTAGAERWPAALQELMTSWPPGQ